MHKPGDYNPLPEDEARRYTVDVYSKSLFCCKKGERGEVYAYYRGSSQLFRIYHDTPIRREGDGEIISVSYNKYAVIRNLGLAALTMALISPSAAEDPKVGILFGAIAALLLGVSAALRQRSKNNAIHELKSQIHREIDTRENAIRRVGGLHAQGAQDVTPAPSGPLVSLNQQFIFPPNQPSSSSSPIDVSAPANVPNYQTRPDAPPQGEEGYPSQEGLSPQTGYGSC